VRYTAGDQRYLAAKIIGLKFGNQVKEGVVRLPSIARDVSTPEVVGGSKNIREEEGCPATESSWVRKQGEKGKRVPASRGPKKIGG